MLAAAAADGHDTNLYTNAGATFVFFLFSLGLVVRPNIRSGAGEREILRRQMRGNGAGCRYHDGKGMGNLMVKPHKPIFVTVSGALPLGK